MTTRFRAVVVLAPFALMATLVAQGDLQVVADVGTDRVTKDDVLVAMRELTASGQLSQTLKVVTAEGRRQIVDDQIERHLFAQAARSAGLDRRPDVKTAIDRVVTAILADAYLETAVQNPPLTAEFLQEYYDAHQSEFVSTGRVKARHIVVRTRTEAEAVLVALKTGADFARMAMENSLEPTTRATGGDLGWVPHGVMAPAFEAALFQLNAGQVSDVVETSFGFHVLRVDQVEPPLVPGFDLVRDRVRERVTNERRARVKDRLMSTYRVTLHSDVLDSITK